MSDVYPPFRRGTGDDEPAVTTSDRDPFPPTADRRSGARTAAVVLCALLLVLGSVLSAAGSVGLWADTTRRDADGFLATGSKSFRTSGYALSFGTVDMRWTRTGVTIGHDWLGIVELRADPDVFVGIGAAADVADYLSGVAYDEVRTNGADIGYRHREGGPAPSAPAARPIWVAYGTGTLAWQAEEGEWAVVVLNPDGSRVVDTRLSARASVPALGPTAAALLLGGVLAVFLSGVVLVVAVLHTFRRGTAG
ncbi:hypothetical protein [Umezawaea sp.]|uniref:hypothetical protein n=1 Tax=Umezawaea sp. TaxID=1955258 RepID=UPI002ED4302D